MSMRTVAIIPARYASTRLPGKPLLSETGKPLIQHVVEAASAAERLEAVYVATDDDRIAEAVKAFGGRAVMTRPDHTTGTDRLAEAAEAVGLADDDIVVNVQGDEPEIDPGDIDRLVALLIDSGAPMATLAAPLSADAAESPDNAKVVLAEDSTALYFSRSKIPFSRDGAGCRHLLHLGIYACRKRFLAEFVAMPPGELEQIEKLEQLRALQAGHRIAVALVDSVEPGIDTPEDYAAFVKREKERSSSI